jgi:hypothetical protein
MCKEMPEAVACARRCRSSRLTGWGQEKNNCKKWWVKEEERQKGSLTEKNKKNNAVADILIFKIVSTEKLAKNSFLFRMMLVFEKFVS